MQTARTEMVVAMASIASLLGAGIMEVFSHC